MKEIFNKRQRFSIRKFSVGVASVLIGITLFQPSQQVFAATDNASLSKVEVSSEKEQVVPTNEKIENIVTTPENRNSTEFSESTTPSNKLEKVETANDKQNVSGKDRSANFETRAVSNSSEVKKYELNEEYAKQIKAGIIASEGNKIDSLLVNGPTLTPEGFTDNDYLKDKDEVYIYEKNGKKYVGYNSHPMLEDTDGDGIIDSKEKADEKLKWNVSERDMIMFMELAYRDDQYIDRVLDHKRPLSESDLYKKNSDTKPRYEYMMMNKELGPYWERKKSYHTSSGLDAVLFETKSDFSYLPNGTAQVLAFRGTSDAKDIKEDITLGFGGNPQQGVDAENIMRELANDKSITNLYLTGHSLGGYLVQRAMVEAYQLAYSDSRVMSPKENVAYRNFYNNILKKGITFNAPKVVTSLVSKREFWQKGLDSKKIAQAGKMTHYITDNDKTIRKGLSNDNDVVINVGSTIGGHSSRSYFEADMINRRPEFISGKRISLDATGYQDPKLTTIKSVEKVDETIVYSKRGDDIIKSTTVSTKDSETGKITKNTTDEVFKKNGAKDKVEVTTIPKTTRYEKDDKREKDTPNVTIEGRNGSRTVTTTYTVNATTGEAIAHRGTPVVEEAQPTIVKVGTKAKVEYLKDGDNIVKKTTTYDVNTDTGTVTPSEKIVVYKENGAKAKVEVTTIPKTTRYEKDDKREKDTPNVTIEGRNGTRTVTTTYTVNATTGEAIAHRGNPVVVEAQPTIVKVGAKAKVEYLKDGDNIVKKTTTYDVNTDTGTVKPSEKIVVYKENGAKSKVEVTTIPKTTRYEKDDKREKDTPNVTIEGRNGSSTVTTTYTVNRKTGEAIAHRENPVVEEAQPTIIKVGAKAKVEYLKDGDNIVKKTTTYDVNTDTGTVTPSEKTVVYKENGAKAKVEVTTLPKTTRYEKDDKREKDSPNATIEGRDGSSTVTTTYTVNAITGEAIEHRENPVVEEAQPTIIKVGAKAKVEYLKDGDNIVKKTTTYDVNTDTGILIPTVTEEIVSPNGVKYTVVVTTIESPIRYEKDSTREKGEANITEIGKTGTSTVTTTYEVNPENGKLIPREGQPVVVSATETVVKVPAKDEKKYIKKGNDVVKEMTTYTVNPTNGTLTPTVTEEVVKKDGAKNTDVVTPIESPIRYEKDSTREKGEANITETGKTGTSTVTTTYEVDPESGNLIPKEGQPVVVPATETVVKVPAKDEKKYIKKGNDVVKEMTTYTVNPEDGTLTSTVTEEVVKKDEPLSPEVPKSNKELIKNTEEKIPVEVNKESKIYSETIERNTNKIEGFNPIASEKELVLPVIDYLLVDRVDKITETVSNVYSLREVENVEYEKIVIPFNHYLPNNLNEILLTDNVSIKETTQVESVTTKNEEIEIKSISEAETSTEGKSNSEVPNEKVKTEEVEHTETSRNNGILIAETVAVLAGVGVLTTVLKRKKSKDK